MRCRYAAWYRRLEPLPLLPVELLELKIILTSCTFDVFFIEYLLPRRLAYAGDLALVCEFSEADTADAELTEISVRAAADLAAVVFSGRELLLFLLL